MDKLISALCITYGRPKLLEEAIESFLRQDYANKEMVIVNDLPEQELVFDHPRIRIFNLKKRVETIGEKRNIAVKLAMGSIVICWDDDDINLPWRMSQVMNVFNSDKNIKYFNLKTKWLWRKNNLSFKQSLCVGLPAIDKKTLLYIGGYNSLIRGEDTDLNKRIAFNLLSQNIKLIAFSKEECPIIYRQHTGYYHLSSVSHKPDAMKIIEDSVKSKPISEIVVLNPHWEQDWLQLTKEATCYQK